MRLTARDHRLLHELFPDGVAARGDLLALGLVGSTVSRRCRAGGPWRSLLPGIVLLGNGDPTTRQQIRAALRYCGAGAILTGATAARRHGVARLPDDRRIHILVPAERQLSSRDFLIVTRTRRLPVPVWRSGMPLAPVARALVDAAARLDRLDTVRAMVADAVQRRICTPDELAAELAEPRRPHTATTREVLVEIGVGIRSAAEAWARRLVLRGGLPEPRWNIAVRRGDGRLIGVADAWWDVGLVWEIDSKEWHLRPEDHDRDTRRQSGFAAEGIPVVHTRPSRLLREGPDVLDELTRAHRKAALTPPPEVTTDLWRR